MSFPKDASKIYDEVISGHDFVREFLVHRSDALQGYHGPFYRSSGNAILGEGALPDNTFYEFLSFMLPMACYGPPQTSMATTRIAATKNVRGLEQATNQFAIDADLQATDEELFTDFAFDFAVGIVERRKTDQLVPGEADQDGNSTEGTDPVYKPHLRRISPLDVSIDHLARSASDRRFTAHINIGDRESMIAHAEANPDEGWEVDGLRAMSLNAGMSRTSRDAEQTSSNREDVTYWVVWVPEAEGLDVPEGEEHLYHGVIYTIAEAYTGDQSVGIEIRKPVDYFGPRWGPYFFGGDKIVPDVPIPLGPATAWASQSRDLNDSSKSIRNRAQRKKRGIIINKMEAEGLADEILDNEDDMVWEVDITAEQIQNAIAQVDVGGLDQQDLAYNELTRTGWQRISGLSDAAKGEVTGVGTATENQIAAASGNKRAAYTVMKFNKLREQYFRTLAWYFFHDEFFVQEIPKSGGLTVAAEGDLGPQPRYRGGVDEERGERPEDFETLNIKVRVGSGRFTSDQENQAKQQALSGLIMDSQALVQMPWVDVDRFVELRAELHQMPELLDVIDAQRLSQLQQMPPAEGGPAQPQTSYQVQKPSGGGITIQGSSGSRGPQPSGPTQTLGQSPGPRPITSAPAQTGTGQQ